MPKVSDILKAGNLVFLPKYQSIGKIEAVNRISPSEIIILVDHYIIGLTSPHNTKQVVIKKIKNKKSKSIYEALEIYETVTRTLKKLQITTEEEAKTLQELNIQWGKGIHLQKIGKALFNILLVSDNNKKLKRKYTSGKENSCRQKYWVG